jgi:hypothetical protein
LNAVVLFISSLFTSLTSSSAAVDAAAEPRAPRPVAENSNSNTNVATPIHQKPTWKLYLYIYLTYMAASFVICVYLRLIERWNALSMALMAHDRCEMDCDRQLNEVLRLESMAPLLYALATAIQDFSFVGGIIPVGTLVAKACAAMVTHEGVFVVAVFVVPAVMCAGILLALKTWVPTLWIPIARTFQPAPPAKRKKLV